MARKARRHSEFGTRMVWTVRTHITTTTHPLHPPATSSTSQPHVVLTCQLRLLDLYEICSHWCQRWTRTWMPYESPAAGDHGSPICHPHFQPPSPAGSWERVADLSLLLLSARPLEVVGPDESLQFSGCSGWVHCCC